MKLKKHLTREEEFEILKLVLDKFLWGGLLVMLYGLYGFATRGADALGESLYIVGAGAVILILFVVLLLREYEVSRLP